MKLLVITALVFRITPARADNQVVITPCEFERARIDVQFAFDGAGRLSGLVFRPASGAQACSASASAQ